MGHFSFLLLPADVNTVFLPPKVRHKVWSAQEHVQVRAFLQPWQELCPSVLSPLRAAPRCANLPWTEVSSLSRELTSVTRISSSPAQTREDDHFISPSSSWHSDTALAVAEESFSLLLLSYSDRWYQGWLEKLLAICIADIKGGAGHVFASVSEVK